MSGVIKRSLVIAGHRTSISLEDAFWRLVKDIARREDRSIAALIQSIDAARGDTNLSSAIRVHCLEWLIENARSRS